MGASICLRLCLLCIIWNLGDGKSLQGYSARVGDCKGGDLNVYGYRLTLQACADKCTSMPNCVGFVYSTYDEARVLPCWPKRATCSNVQSKQKTVTYDKVSTEASSPVSCNLPKTSCTRIACPNGKRETIPKFTPFTRYGCCGSKMFSMAKNACVTNQITSCNKYKPFRCRNGNCIFDAWKCNGVNSCSDGSDEVGCGSCSSGQFRCRDGQCVSDSYVCNRVKDCLDGSDESHCSTKSGGWCGNSQYRCNTDRCISMTKVCNGDDNCGDNSDEVNCKGGGQPTESPGGSTPKPGVKICGNPAIKPSTRGRVVGGKPAIPNSWPWMVSLRRDKVHMCGGTIINPQWILTATHCTRLWRGDVNAASVIVGMHSQKKPLPFQKEIKVVKIIEHEDYDSNTYNNDIALLKLSTAIVYRKEITQVCLPKSSEGYSPGTECYTTGWGRLWWQGKKADYLQQVQVPLIARKTCNKPEWYGGAITDKMMCAGYENGMKDSCAGDSGGPLVCQVNKIWKQIGVVSWGEKCAERKKPGVYTRVQSFLVWIQRKISSN